MMRLFKALMMSAMAALSLAAPTEVVAGRVLTHHNLLPLDTFPTINTLHTTNALRSVPLHTTHALHPVPAVPTHTLRHLPAVSTNALHPLSTHALHHVPA